MNKLDYFETAYDRSIHDMEQLKLDLKKKLHKLKDKAEKSDVFITYTDNRGDTWEARTWYDLQDSYAANLISMKKFEKLAESLEKKQMYSQQPVMIGQIEQEIRLVNNIVKEITEAKEKKWPLV